jgi:hypothetical protein
LVKVIEYDYEISSASGEHPVLRSATFKVSKQTLIDNSSQDPRSYFKTMFKNYFHEAQSKEIILEDDSVMSVEVWFRVFHNNFEEDTYTVDIKEVWEVIATGKKYLFDMEKAEKWFEEYYKRLDLENLEYDDLTQLLFPCQNFDHALAFARITQRLAVEARGHIVEHNPTRHRDLHCEGRVIRKYCYALSFVV